MTVVDTPFRQAALRWVLATSELIDVGNDIRGSREVWEHEANTAMEEVVSIFAATVLSIDVDCPGVGVAGNGAGAFRFLGCALIEVADRIDQGVER